MLYPLSYGGKTTRPEWLATYHGYGGYSVGATWTVTLARECHDIVAARRWHAPKLCHIAQPASKDYRHLMVCPEAHDPALAQLDRRVRNAIAAAGLPDFDPEFERPKLADHGDWATTVALRLAKPAGKPPRAIAEAIVDKLDAGPMIADVDIAGPGFINFRFSSAYYADLLQRVIEAADNFGRAATSDDAEVVNVEFVSANPTGPLHVGAGRWAATGDAIAELLAATGHRVVREYYVNDAGEQVRRFGESLQLVALDEPLGDDHYRGAIVGEIVAVLRQNHGDEVFDDADPEQLGALGVAEMRQRIEDVLHRVGVDYDVWFSEQARLHDSGAIDATISQLRAGGRTYEDDGALFLTTTVHGDDKDRVLVRSDGRPTYFAADCAYLRDKWSRSDRLFYLLGADHHGYVARLHAAAACLDIPVDRVEIRIGQLVNLLRDGEPVRMSKRAGQTIDLDEVLDEVGVDVTRYHFLRQGLDTQVDFDLALVAQQSMENPVYYVQYAHARINSLIRTADARGFDHGTISDVDLSLLSHPAERELLAAMAHLPIVVADAAELRATQRLARYAEELAGTFHRFYTECRVLVEGAETGEDLDAVALGRSRYWLAFAAKQVLANALALLRVSAPERM
ncbi:MAG: arginine--tRNA ligase [Nitriliruptoraceae bacterium]